MVKIWTKLIFEEKIISSKIVEIDDYYHSSKFEHFVRQVCYEIDIPTPIILFSHKFNFTNFNIAKFKSSEFVETVDFDTLVLENVIE